MCLSLYLLSLNNEDDEDLDQFITADSPEAAVSMFRAQWELKQYSGPILKGAPTHTEGLRIFLPRYDPDIAGVLSWHDTRPDHHGYVELIGYVLP